jgi:dTDP-glucose 4,6-dehydratase
MEISARTLPGEDLQHLLTYGEPAWRSLQGARLFIAGGTGFFGTWLLEAIAAANAKHDARITATVLSRSPSRFRARAPRLAALPCFEWIAGDVRDFAFPDGSWTHVIHAAASTSAELETARPGELFETIVNGTQRVLEFASERRAAELLFVSSGAVYGRQPSALERVPESYVEGGGRAVPESAYGQGKRAAERLCAITAQSGALRPRIARCFAFVGPHLPLAAHFAAGNFLRDAVAGRDIEIRGDGTALRSYLHPADLVVWLLAILTRGTPGRAYNVGSDDAVSIRELAGRIAALAPSRLGVVVRGVPAGNPAERYVPSVERARAELGLEVRIGLDNALRRTYRWLRDGPA